MTEFHEQDLTGACFERIEYAAALVHQSASDFARAAAEDRAEQVLREHSLATTVPAAFFESLLAAFDNPPQPNAALFGSRSASP